MNKATRALLTATEHPIDPSQHQRRCTICHHPDRESIEEAFLQWRSPHHMLGEFKITDRTTIYRHAHALGLFAQRRRNLRAALENVIEESETIHPTGSELIAAVRAMTCLKDSGDWIEPPTSHRVLAGAALGHAVAAAISVSSDLSLSAPVSENLIGTPLQSENLIATQVETGNAATY
jgi:hypothetical protein